MFGKVVRVVPAVLGGEIRARELEHRMIGGMASASYEAKNGGRNRVVTYAPRQSSP